MNTEEPDDEKSIVERLKNKHGLPSAAEALSMAAVLTEHAAYELAREADGSSVADLILTAAQLERRAREMREAMDENEL